MTQSTTFKAKWAVLTAAAGFVAFGAPVQAQRYAPSANQPGYVNTAPQRVNGPVYRPTPQPVSGRYAPGPSQSGYFNGAPQRVNTPVYRRAQQPVSGGQMPQTMRGAQSHVPLSLFDKLFTRKNFNHYASFSDRMRDRRRPIYQRPANIPDALNQFQRWEETDAQYVLYPGDQVDIVVPSAPELSRTLTVGPDGRVVMPMTKPVMAAGRTMMQLSQSLQAQLATQLRDPRVDVTPRAYSPQQVFVGGEVGQQGTYTLPGPIGALEAVFMAGGFSTSAQSTHVVVLRRHPNGRMMARLIDFRDGLNNPRTMADTVQLRRGDIIFVPRSNVAEVGLFMQQYVREALPIDASISYNLGESFRN
ncbi:polysaccharide biosynthesis/export family protein [Robiginitomaculum antarcticum]|uniref:polysaccharide biosynthesis/export family protein n=1 Tax=Robiginitomaculum antarcticum TaxID=437507 RepID=UPI000381BA1E|nr:polysaccharide biosynthesis/export family protein [Robiginitomaculum antarcticum]